MSSMTIDQLKKSLTEQGISLPPSRSKKADYLKLYKQYSTMNDSLGDVYSSDDENPPKTGSQNVTSSTSPNKNNVIKDVEMLSDDELYHQLKEFDANIGPVLKNTRRVYEKKLIKILSGLNNSTSSNVKGTNSTETKNKAENFTPPVDEFSDSDVEVISPSPIKNDAKNRKGSELRESPKPSVTEPTKFETEKSYVPSYERSGRSTTPGLSSDAPKTSRYSYIETIPKGSSYSYIEQSSDLDLSSDLRKRFADRYNSEKYSEPLYSERHINDKPSSGDIYKSYDKVDHFKTGLGSQLKFGLDNENQYKSGFNTVGQYKPNIGVSNRKKSGSGFGDHYIGTWEPNINRYLGTNTQKLNSQRSNSSVWLKSIIAG